MSSPTFTRRQALRGGAALLGGAALAATSRNVASGRTQPAAPSKTAIVVGSGFGGSVAALRLGQAGYRTCVFERGRRWPTKDDGFTFPRLMSPDGRSAWFSDRPNVNQLTRVLPIQRYPGLVDRIHGNGIDAIFGAGIGGGSLAFGYSTPQPRQREWDQIFPKDIPFSEMDSPESVLPQLSLGTVSTAAIQGPNSPLVGPTWRVRNRLGSCRSSP